MSLTQKFDNWKHDFDEKNKINIAEAGAIYTQSLDSTLSKPGDADHPSKPGEAPHEVTGRLRASIVSEVDPSAGVARSGTTALYAKYLLAKRDYYRIAWDRVASKIQQILLKR